MYKTSKYNYLIDYKGKKLFFNGLNGSGILMQIAEWNNVENLLNDLIIFERDYPTEFGQFKHFGYIIDNELDELAYIKHKNKTITYSNDSFNLVINPTLECNFHCWYCYEKHRCGHMSEKTINSIKSLIKRKIEKDGIKSLELGWFGGEPLLYFDSVVLPISQYAKEICNRNNVCFINGITTNGFCIDNVMIEKMGEIELKNFQITLDGNRERHNKIRNNNGEASYDVIVNNINNLCSNISNSTVCVRINYDEVTFKNGLVDILDDFLPQIRPHLIIDLHRVWQTFSKLKTKERYDNRINNEELDDFVTKAKDKGYIIRCGGNINAITLYNCYACRMNYACINFDGKIYKCTARSFSDEDCVGKLNDDGYIEWNETRLSRLYGFSPLENKKCMDCKYLPLCMGPCPQHYMEDNHEINCILNNLERNFENRIIDFYEESLRLKKLNNP